MKRKKVLIADIQRENSPVPDKGFVENIRENGVIEPIILMEGKIKYRIIDGRRRIDACELLGEEAVCAEVIEGEDIEKCSPELLLLTLQLHRTPNPGVELQALKDLVKQGFTLEEIAGKLHVNAAKLKRIFRLINLCPQGIKLLRGGQMKQSKALSLSRLPVEKQEALLSEYGYKIKTEDIEAAIRERNLGTAQEEFDAFLDLPKINPVQMKLEELVAIVSVNNKLDDEVIKAIEVMRSFVSNNFPMEGGLSHDSDQNSRETGMREPSVRRPVCVLPDVAARSAA